ncbi:hypothetical protein IL306_009269 [Fusarium sp. DS 682]|nr:hypothetical protein IL306_009269 [Fusarium sp. DS 682]
MDSTENALVEPIHKGILRDETIMLRWIFGYCPDSQLLNGVSWPDLTQTSVAKGVNSHIKDLGFLSIDIDRLREENGAIQQVQIGVSFLKAQSLQELHRNATPGSNLASQVIKSQHWVIGAKGAFSWKGYHLLLGKARSMNIPDLGAELEKFTRKPYVLVVHEAKQELSFLERLNIKLDPVFILDTVKAAQFPLQLYYRNSLQQLLEEFEIPYAQLHVAGNDAHLTLRALLMIAVRDAEIQLAGRQLPDWIPILKYVAQSPLPPRPPTKRELAGLAAAEAERQKMVEERVISYVRF